MAVLAAAPPHGIRASPSPERPHFGSTYPYVERGIRPAATDYSLLRSAAVPVAPMSKVAIPDLVPTSHRRRKAHDDLVQIQGLGNASRTEAELGG